MKLAIEGTPLATPPFSGVARVNREILLALLDHDDVEQIGLYVKASRLKRRHLLPKHEKLRIHPWLSEKAKSRWQRYDALIAPQDRLPRGCARHTLVYVHDLYVAHGVNFFDQARRLGLLRKLRAQFEVADHLVCISNATRCELLEQSDFDPARVSVVRHGLGAGFSPRPEHNSSQTLRTLGIERPFLFFSGLAHQNKNLARLLVAFRQSGLHEQMQLVISGPSQPGSPDGRRLDVMLNLAGLGDRVIRPGYVSDEQLIDLYSRCAGFVFPSLMEGFGLPILEAMACGAPVMTSDRSACREVAAEHAVLVNPHDVASIATGLHALRARSSRQNRAAQAFARTRTWRHSADELVELVRRLD